MHVGHVIVAVLERLVGVLVRTFAFDARRMHVCVVRTPPLFDPNATFRSISTLLETSVAEGLARKILGHRIRVESAGSAPAGVKPIIDVRVDRHILSMPIRC